ncbi:probable galacturonosyltransferase 7 isoform X2 [Malania oleifera]|uniref:probable galacturonosyltransferase 7 isoform X2 n=1 Tax=Malania oleifera TaxID=397392 RepID=UPI0025AE8399|nr:probable galacturonosyltransferase 7 isoform X2 [Malania oleifera]
MKGGIGGGGSYSLPAKRRWRGLAIAVLCLVFLSMLVPLVFLLGLHNGFPSAGYLYDQQPAVSGQLRHVDELMKRLGPTLSKDVIQNFVKEVENETTGRGAIQVTNQKGSPMPPYVVPKAPSNKNSPRVDSVGKVTGRRKAVDDESGKSCELKYGSYCLWRQENREEMKDRMVKKLKDQLFVARAYFPTIAKLPKHGKFSHELKMNIQDLERVLSVSITDGDLPKEIDKKSNRMEAAIARAKSFVMDCNNVDKKLRQIYDMTEDEADFHMKQSAYLFQLAVQTMPKSLHCLSMRLTVEYFKSPLIDMKPLRAEKYSDPMLQHYAIFSSNVLASSVVINSTVMHAKESGNLVFHVVTDRNNYFAMKLWFLINTYKEVTVQVLNIEDLNLNYHDKATLLQLSLPAEFRVSLQSVYYLPKSGSRTEYLSVFSHSHYLLPEIFQNLKKVVVMDDDIVVQQDLSALWDLDMDGKVNGAVNFCGVRLGQLNSYTGQNGFDGSSCAWISGLNIIDLVSWREHNVTNAYWKYVQELSMGDGLPGPASLPASLLTFQGLVYALDGTWVLSGLGHDYGLDIKTIKKAAVLHYNGKMKPWLELGIPKYKAYWKQFLKQEDQFMSECNVNS